jgi:cell division control protein 6
MGGLLSGLDTYILGPSGAGRIFKNRIPLENTYVPDKLTGRTKEISELRSHLDVLKVGVNPMNLTIFGSTGYGKTVVAKHVVRQITEEANAAGTKVVAVYVNGSHVSSFGRLMLEMMSQLEQRVSRARTPCARGDEAPTFLRMVDELAAFVVVIVDEVDKLPLDVCNRLLYILSRPAELMVTKSHITVIAIANNVRFGTSLPAPTQSSFGRLKLFFTPYTANDIFHILKDRVALTLAPGVCSDEVLLKCAERAAMLSGDARLALDLIHRAANMADSGGRAIISPADMDAAETELEIDTMNRSIKNLIAFHRFVLYSIVLSGLEEPSTGQIHSALGNFCRLKGIRSVSLARVSQIITSLAAEGYLNTRCVNRGMKGGNTRLITLAPHVDRATLRDLALVELKSG